MKTLREYIDQLDEISRRGFLKGAGAVCTVGALTGCETYDEMIKIDWNFGQAYNENWNAGDMLANIKLTNISPTTSVKDIELKFTWFAESGTEVGSDYLDIYKILTPGQTVELKRKNLGWQREKINTGKVEIHMLKIHYS
jgi:hypothetical protein